MNDTEYRKFKNSRFYGYFDLLKEEIARLGQMGVQFLFFQTPLRQNIKNLSEFEHQRLLFHHFPVKIVFVLLVIILFIHTRSLLSLTPTVTAPFFPVF